MTARKAAAPAQKPAQNRRTATKAVVPAPRARNTPAPRQKAIPKPPVPDPTTAITITTVRNESIRIQDVEMSSVEGPFLVVRHRAVEERAGTGPWRVIASSSRETSIPIHQIAKVESITKAARVEALK